MDSAVYLRYRPERVSSLLGGLRREVSPENGSTEVQAQGSCPHSCCSRTPSLCSGTLRTRVGSPLTAPPEQCTLPSGQPGPVITWSGCPAVPTSPCPGGQAQPHAQKTLWQCYLAGQVGRQMLQAAREGQAGGGVRAGTVGQGVWGLPLGALGESSHAPGVGAEASGLKGAWGSQACWGHGGGAPGGSSADPSASLGEVRCFGATSPQPVRPGDQEPGGPRLVPRPVGARPIARRLKGRGSACGLGTQGSARGGWLSPSP